MILSILTSPTSTIHWFSANKRIKSARYSNTGNVILFRYNVWYFCVYALFVNGLMLFWRVVLAAFVAWLFANALAVAAVSCGPDAVPAVDDVPPAPSIGMPFSSLQHNIDKINGSIHKLIYHKQDSGQPTKQICTMFIRLKNNELNARTSDESWFYLYSRMDYSFTNAKLIKLN